MLDNAWLIPLIPAVSFVIILFFGKRMPKKGAEMGILALGAAFVLSLLCALEWVGEQVPRHPVRRHLTCSSSAASTSERASTSTG